MLHVYRASAGSGKTYKLTLEYLKLLLSPVRPNNEPILPSERNKAFQHILAVTFTNKATEEMKRRIIEKLDILAHRTSESEYLNDLLGQDGIPASIEKLQKRAQKFYLPFCTISRVSISVLSTSFFNKRHGRSLEKSVCKADTIPK